MILWSSNWTLIHHRLKCQWLNLFFDNEEIASRIDVLYFEHHVMLSEMGPYWAGTREGSVQQSIEMFADFRRKGIASHFWP
jgi:hypothetical protein